MRLTTTIQESVGTDPILYILQKISLIADTGQKYILHERDLKSYWGS